MHKKYLHIIALSAIMSLCGNSHAVPEKDVCDNYNADYTPQNEKNCKNQESCYWRQGGTPCKSIPKNCTKFTPKECQSSDFKKFCSLNKDECELRVDCNSNEFKNSEYNCKKYSSQCTWVSAGKTPGICKKIGSGFSEDSASKKTLSIEELCTKRWFKGTCKSESKTTDCVWLKSSSKTNAGQKSGCHSKSEFYDKNKDYFDIEPF